ncbi:9807_t:CDS:2 [Entrophospora sp. SA101]|nr:9807_t:CDS:2 [Entrophospora sp. SA101]CAJ0921584.1 21627_t:CDS:2 [Entrophospora sp. SA101]
MNKLSEDQDKCTLTGRELYHTKFPPPSTVAQPKNWKNYQEAYDPFILNYHSHTAFRLLVTLCEPVFAEFERSFRDCQMDKFDTDFVIELSCEMSYTFVDEDVRKEAFCSLLKSSNKKHLCSPISSTSISSVPNSILYQTAHMLKPLKVALGKLRNIYDNQPFEYVTIAGKTIQLTYIDQIRKHLIFEAYVNVESGRPYRNGGIDHDVSNAVIESVKLLHSNGFVHGDLRSPNIMIGKNNQMKFLDFEWADKEGEATYPMLLNTEFGCYCGGKIKSIHDKHIIKN